MRKTVILTAVALCSTAVWAQEQGRVLSATPIVQQVGVPQQVCGNETVYSGSRNSGAGAVMGAIAGGAAGNAIGKGNGRVAATALGVIGGAVLGNQIEGSGRPQYETVQRCTTETYFENRTVGYNVVYEYAGRQYTTRTQNEQLDSFRVQLAGFQQSLVDSQRDSMQQQSQQQHQVLPEWPYPQQSRGSGSCRSARRQRYP